MFPITRWSVVASARDRSAPAARQALEELCGTYWYPIYAYVRRRGHDRDAAGDLTQEFFARLLEADSFAAVDPARGRFRSFLLAACRHFLANEYDRSTAAKRGGGRQPRSLALDEAEGRYGCEPATDQTPDRLFERRWALTLLEAALERLQAEYESGGKGTTFAALKQRLTGDAAEPYAAVAARLGMTEGAAKVAVHRMRDRYRELLRDEIGQTVADLDAVDDEIRALFAALGG